MKRTFAITFLSLFLLSSTGFHELLKVPALVNHYQEHQQEMPDITLWQFLCIHYAQGEVMDADHDKDMKLPYKTMDNCSSTNYITLLSEEKFDFEKNIPVVMTKNIPSYYNEIIITHSLNSIWQPPKIS